MQAACAEHIAIEGQLQDCGTVSLIYESKLDPNKGLQMPTRGSTQLILLKQPNVSQCGKPEECQIYPILSHASTFRVRNALLTQWMRRAALR